MPITAEKLPFTRVHVERAPEASGVYAILAGGEIAYYGAALGGRDTIRRRLLEHLTGRRAPGTSSGSAFLCEVTGYPKSRTCALLEEHRRKMRRLPLFNMPDTRRQAMPQPILELPAPYEVSNAA
jgi:hypothetical protein